MSQCIFLYYQANILFIIPAFIHKESEAEEEDALR